MSKIPSLFHLPAVYAAQQKPPPLLQLVCPHLKTLCSSACFGLPF